MTAEERAEIGALIHGLYESSGERSWAAFARRAGVSEFSLSEWRSGRGTPSAINLIRLLRSVGWLRPGEAEPSPATGSEGLERLEAAAKEQTTSLRGVARRLARLEEAVDRLAPAQAAEAQQTRRGHGRR